MAQGRKEEGEKNLKCESSTHSLEPVFLSFPPSPFSFSFILFGCTVASLRQIVCKSTRAQWATSGNASMHMLSVTFHFINKRLPIFSVEKKLWIYQVFTRIKSLEVQTFFLSEKFEEMLPPKKMDQIPCDANLFFECKT